MMKPGLKQNGLSVRASRWGLLPWVVLLLSLIMTFAATRIAFLNQLAREKSRFDLEAQSSTTAIQNSINTYLTLLDSVRGLSSVQDSISQQEFHSFVSQLALPTNYPGIQTLGVALRVNPTMTTDWRKLLSDPVRSQFKIWPASGQDETCPILYAEPADERNQARLGFDIFTEPILQKPALKAIETGRLAATGKFGLIQKPGPENQMEFTIYAPVYRKNELPASVEDRRRNFVCFIFCTFRADDFFQLAVEADRNPHLGVKVYDRLEVSPERLLVTLSPEEEAAYEKAAFKATNIVSVADHRWTVVSYPKPEFLATSPSNPAPFLLVAGLVVTALLFVFAAVQARVHAASERHVAELEHSAASLRKQETTLAQAQRIARLGNWERDLRTNVSIWSDETYRIFGLSPQESSPEYETFLQLVHPEDRDMVRNAALAAINGIKPYNIEHRIQLPDGTIKTVHQQAEIVHDENGQALSIMGTVQDITDRKTAELARTGAEAKFRRLVEQSLTGIYIIQDGRFIYVNPQLTAMLGFSQAELTAAPVFDFIHPEDRPAARENIRRRLTGELESIRYGLRMLRRDGSTLFAEVHGGRIEYEGQPAIMGTMLDVSERKQAEESLRESQARLLLATRASNIGYWDWNVKTGEVYFSPEWKSQLGYREDEIQGHVSEWETRLHPDDTARVKTELADFFAGAKPEYAPEFRLRHKDGSYRWIYTRGEMIRDDEGRPVRVIGCHVDLTEQKLVAEQLRQSQKMQAVGQLAGGIAHDFNNILTVIKGHCEMLRLEPLPDQMMESVDEVSHAADRAANLTRQLLLFSRQQPMQQVSLDLHRAVQDTAKMLHRLIGENIHLKVEQGTNGLPLIAGDVGMIEQVLLNLSVNARDAMPQGGEVIIRTNEVTLAEDSRPGRKAGRYVCLTISDNGTGIPEEILPQIFEPFFTTKEVGRGTGLGLATVHGIMKQHGGWVEVASTKGMGTTFTLYFPATPQLKASRPEPVENTKQPGGSETILLVEDEPALRRMIQLTLRRSGYRVLEAANAAEALNLWQENPDQINLLITDMVMPGNLNGWQLYQQLLVYRPDLKAIIMSGYSRTTEADGWRETFSGIFLQKPFTPAVLTQSIRASLDAVSKKV